MPRYLFINPNTNPETTLKLHRLFAARYPEIQLEAVTARFGARYISCEASYAVAAHACIDAWYAFQKHNKQPIDGVLIGCFGDPGLYALKDLCDCPVTGLAESSLIQASMYGDFAIVTGGQRWKVMLERLIQNLGYCSQLKSIITVDPTGAELQANPLMAKDILTRACDEAASHNVNAIILGGAGLAGYQSDIQPLISLPLIDSAIAGLACLVEQQIPRVPHLLPSEAPYWHALPGYYT